MTQTERNLAAPRVRIGDVVQVGSNQGGASNLICVVVDVSQQHSLNGFRRATVHALGAGRGGAVTLSNEGIEKVLAFSQCAPGFMLTSDKEKMTDADICEERGQIVSATEWANHSDLV